MLNGTPRTLVGIMPPRFGWYAADVFFPATLTGRDTTAREFWFLLGRLKPGVSIAQAKAELTVIAHRLAKMDPQEYPQQFAVHVGTLGDSVVERIRPTLYTALVAVGLLLLIACSNVANLLLARATAREKEFALRTVLGAGRSRLVRLLVVESLVLAISGAALGIFLAWGGLKALVAALPARVIPSESVIELNAPVLAVTLGIAVLTALISGLAPALQSFRRDLSDPLRDSGKGTSSGFRGRRLRDGVVVMEVALSLTLLIGAGLLMRSFVALREVRLGRAGGPHLHGGAAIARGPLRDGRAGDRIPAAAAGASQGAPRSRACGGIDHGRPRPRPREQDGDRGQGAGQRIEDLVSAGHRRPLPGLCGSSSRREGP